MKNAPKFITIGEAAEILLLAGCTVKIEKDHKFEGCAHTVSVIIADGVVVAGGYRDGASWKLKAETIQDFADDYERSKENGSN